jgi:hypothetical protein
MMDVYWTQTFGTFVTLDLTGGVTEHYTCRFGSTARRPIWASI